MVKSVCTIQAVGCQGTSAPGTLQTFTMARVWDRLSDEMRRPFSPGGSIVRADPSGHEAFRSHNRDGAVWPGPLCAICAVELFDSFGLALLPNALSDVRASSMTARHELEHACSTPASLRRQSLASIFTRGRIPSGSLTARSRTSVRFFSRPPRNSSIVVNQSSMTVSEMGSPRIGTCLFHASRSSSTQFGLYSSPEDESPREA